MRTIKIILTDAEYAELMMKANYVREDSKTHHREGFLLDAKTFLAMCAKLNLKNNIERFAKAVTMK
jgi:hypothetical protein